MIFPGKARLFSLFLMSHYGVKFCIGGDVITSTEYIQDPGSITSSGGLYRMGFFSPNGSANRYVGIWNNNVPTYYVLWVANRKNPILDSSGVVMISHDGNLVVMNGKREILWSSNVSNSVTDAKAQLSDSGNLLLIKRSSNSSANNAETLWESFQHMTDSFLEKMKLSTNSGTNEKQALTSWKSPSDPSVGSFSGVESIYVYGFVLVDDKAGTVYVTYTSTQRSFMSYYLLKSSGDIVQLHWNSDGSTWEILWSSWVSDCDVYGKCGPFGLCNPKKSPICSCLRGFEPKHNEEWSRGNWSSGFVRKKLLQCTGSTDNSSQASKEDGFFKLKKVKVPDFAVWTSPIEANCSVLCLNNCSCIAYAYHHGIGCMHWSGHLLDLQKFSIGGTDVYLRLAHRDLDEKRNLRTIIAATVMVTIFSVITLCFAWKKVNKQGVKKSLISEETKLGENLAKVSLQELVLYKFEALVVATSNFSNINKLGKGGFGPVYWGRLLNGQEIAVKRLSRASGQGLKEFVNETVVILKVQHRNLVRLLGCCVEEEEKILIYGFMPNKSLDAFLFDPLKPEILDWRRRFNIIDGICRGLLYLHRDSRLRIIHRDLKASNILLDEKLNPKISDFGVAQIFGGNEDQANTRRVVGTYGYMAPEYAMEGRFSEKSDVYSFGVLLLEIISGRQNTSFNEECLSLLGFAWKLWKEDNALALADPKMSITSFEVEVLRCTKVGLLCTQELAKDRPTISTVISMLNSEIVDLPSPKQPAFTEREINRDKDSSEQSQKKYSANNVTLTTIEGR